MIMQINMIVSNTISIITLLEIHIKLMISINKWLNVKRLTNYNISITITISITLNFIFFIWVLISMNTAVTAWVRGCQ